MKLVILSSFFQKNKVDEILHKSKGLPIANANSIFQHAVLKGLSNHISNDIESIECINMPNIGAYPSNYTDTWYRESNYNIYNIPVSEPKFLNVLYLKHIYKYIKIKQSLTKILEKSEKVTVLCYDLYAPWLKALEELKSKFDFKLIVLIPDLPDKLGTPDSLPYRIYNKLPLINSYKRLSAIDGYILLAESMKKPLGIESQPYMIMEGIYDSFDNNENLLLKRNEPLSKRSDTFSMMYSGALTKRNGIRELIEAVRNIDYKKIVLYLYGAGELMEEIKSISSIDNRIKYMGQVSHEVILKVQSEMDLLVNPRKPELDFSQYSFPSKTMEYMASGVPVLMYKLRTLPEEYWQHLFLIDDSREENLKEAIIRVMDIPNNELNQKGNNAKEFILNNKSSLRQGEALMDFINLVNSAHE